MNYLILTILSLFTITNAYSNKNPIPKVKTTQSSETVNIKVIVTNVNSQKGIIRLGLFNTSESFLNKGEEFRTYTLRPDGNTATFNLRNLPKNNYAISLYHDLNSDDKCNLNWVLRPAEPIGFSNNVKLKLFKPSFEECMFVANKDLEIRIKLED
nr:DUF2141 domain-containing protein [uncultured Brumimicrobium sp.]